MTQETIKELMLFPEIRNVIDFLLEGTIKIFGRDLTGYYLFGSLTYGDFNPGSSDSDLLAIVKQKVSKEQLELLKQLHQESVARFGTWAKRLECSYTPQYMLHNFKPPTEPRPYYGDGTFYREAEYGNEWIINLYLLYKFGVTLYGVELKKVVPEVMITDVQAACRADLVKEWVPKMADVEYWKNAHYVSYIILNLCRILYTIKTGDARSKKVAAEWVKKEYIAWSDLVSEAQSWSYGMEMNAKERTVEFIKFVVTQVGA